jgi:hypothetical protein
LIGTYHELICRHGSPGDCRCRKSPALFVRCFSGLESRNVNNLLLISIRRVRAVSKHFMDHFAVIGPFTAGNSETYRCYFCPGFGEVRNSAPPSNVAAVLSRQKQRKQRRRGLPMRAAAHAPVNVQTSRWSMMPTNPSCPDLIRASTHPRRPIRCETKTWMPTELSPWAEGPRDKPGHDDDVSLRSN